MSKLLCIDLGSAYTKLAVRASWNATSELLGSDDDRDEWAFCIPSIVARIDRRGVQWRIGEDALETEPASNVVLHRNWKADLFAGGAKATAAAEVARHFFAELHKYLRGKGHERLLATCRTRLCVPCLPGNEAVAASLQLAAEEAGFSFVDERPCIFEPESNVSGVLTRGKNKTWRDKPWDPLCPSYHVMFKETTSRFLPRLQAMARAKFIKPFIYRVLTVDIGAFTTDLSCVEFKVVDGDVDGLERPEVCQESQSIGIGDLDKKILKQLGPEAEETFAAKSAKDWEIVKRLLYDGQPARIRKPQGGVLALGEDDQFYKIAKTIERFAGRVQAAITAFCEKSGGEIDEAVLTGGGAMISSLREAVTDELRDSVTEDILDLLDPEEASRFLYRATPTAIEARTKTNRQLLRGGSAIGGCSVFVDLPQHAVVEEVDGD